MAARGISVASWKSTGEVKPWLYPDAPHIGATSWCIFAALARNPYHLRNGTRP
jgi:hypothetical protein